MQSKKILPILGLLMFSPLVTSCGGESQTNGKLTTTELKIMAVPTTLSQTQSLQFQTQAAEISVPNSGVTITSALLHVEEIELKLPNGVFCSDLSLDPSSRVVCKTDDDDDDDDSVDSEIKIRGPIVFDLLTGESTPSLSSIKIPSGLYREIEIELEEAKRSDGLVSEDSGLIGKTIYIEGSIEDSSQNSFPFRLAFEMDDDIEIEAKQGLNIQEGTINQMVLALNVSSWFENTDLQACLESGKYPLNDDGEFFLDDDDDRGSDECDDIEDDIEDRIKNSFEARDSSDDDDSDEDDDNDD